MDKEKISIDDFSKIEVKIGTVRSAVRVPETDKLLRLTVDFNEVSPESGEKTVRQIISGIATYVSEPESLIGRQLDLSLGMTFTQLAEYMLDLGCDQAMNLDGGGSATLWAFGSVKNSPSEGQERAAPNALVVVRPNPTTASK